MEPSTVTNTVGKIASTTAEMNPLCMRLARKGGSEGSSQSVVEDDAKRWRRQRAKDGGGGGASSPDGPDDPGSLLNRSRTLEK